MSQRALENKTKCAYMPPGQRVSIGFPGIFHWTAWKTCIPIYYSPYIVKRLGYEN